MALVALAQAVATAALGPRRPYWIETWPAAALTINLGMVKAETLSGPFSISRVCWVSISLSPPMPEPRITPQRNVIFSREVQPGIAHGVDGGDHGELRETVEPLAILRRDDSRRSSNAAISPPKRTRNSVVSNAVIGTTPLSPCANPLPEILRLVG